MRPPLLLLALFLASCGDSRQVSESGSGAFEPSLAVRDDGFMVAWHDNRHGNDEIYLRQYDDPRNPLGGEQRLTRESLPSYEADVAALGRDIAVAWYNKNEAGHLSVKLGLWSGEGEILWVRDISSPDSQGRIPVVEAFGDRLFIAWVEDPRLEGGSRATARASGLYSAWLNPQGGYLTEPFLIGNASATTWNLNADMSEDGQVALVYDADFETRASELYLVKIWHNQPHGFLVSQDDGYASKYPDIALNGSLAALTWFDEKYGNNEIYLRYFDILSVTQYDPPPVLDGDSAIRITHTQGDSIGAYLEWNGDTLGLVWNDDEAGQHEIHYQTFDLAGSPRTSSVRLTDTPESSLIPAIHAWRDGFVVAWSEAVLAVQGGHGGSATRSEIFIRYIE